MCIIHLLGPGPSRSTVAPALAPLRISFPSWTLVGKWEIDRGDTTAGIMSEGETAGSSESCGCALLPHILSAWCAIGAATDGHAGAVSVSRAAGTGWR
jgi:hypothetical protein